MLLQEPQRLIDNGSENHSLTRSVGSPEMRESSHRTIVLLESILLAESRTRTLEWETETCADYHVEIAVKRRDFLSGQIEVGRSGRQSAAGFGAVGCRGRRN